MRVGRQAGRQAASSRHWRTGHCWVPRACARVCLCASACKRAAEEAQQHAPQRTPPCQGSKRATPCLHAGPSPSSSLSSRQPQLLGIWQGGAGAHPPPPNLFKRPPAAQCGQLGTWNGNGKETVRLAELFALLFFGNWLSHWGLLPHGEEEDRPPHSAPNYRGWDGAPPGQHMPCPCVQWPACTHASCSHNAALLPHLRACTHATHAVRECVRVPTQPRTPPPPPTHHPATHTPVQLRSTAKVHLSQQQYEDALSCLDLAIDLDSTSYKVGATSGVNSTALKAGLRVQPLAQGHRGNSRCTAATAHQPHPPPAQLFRLRSIANSCLREFEGSAADAARVIQLCPSLIDGYYHLVSIRRAICGVPGCVSACGRHEVGGGALLGSRARRVERGRGSSPTACTAAAAAADEDNAAAPRVGVQTQPLPPSLPPCAQGFALFNLKQYAEAVGGRSV